jgi:hypothetical protein
MYADQLERWFGLFPHEQLLILKSEAFYADPAAILNETYAFLSVSSWKLAAYDAYNRAEYAAMNPATRARLVDYYAPHNARLYDLLGRDLGWEG